MVENKCSKYTSNYVCRSNAFLKGKVKIPLGWGSGVEMERSSDVSLILLWLFTQSDSPSHPWPSIHPAKRKPSSWRGWGSQHLLTQPHPLKETSPSRNCMYLEECFLCIYCLSALKSNSTTYSCGTFGKFLKHANLYSPLPYENN